MDSNGKDPLDAVFLSPQESAEMKELKLCEQLATYLSKMPPELKALFWKEFQRKASMDE